MNDLKKRSLVVAGVLVAMMLICDDSIASPAYQRYELRSLQRALELYKVHYGAYPPVETDGQSWYELLIDRNIMSQTRCTSPDGRYPLDVYGNPIIYELVIQSGELVPVLRSVGWNGIDDGGAGDDWDTRYGAHWGHWHKRHYPAAMWWAVAFAFAFACAAVVLRRSRYRTGVLVALAGIGCLVVPYVADKYLFSSARTGPKLLEYSMIAGAMLAFLGLAIGVRSYHKKATANRLQLCIHCGYPKKGLDHNTCPECGSLFDK